MSNSNLPPEPPPVFLPEPKREPEPRLRPSTTKPEPGRLKFDFPADTPPAPTEPAPRGKNFSRFVFWLILGVMLVASFETGSPIPIVIVIVAAFLFRKRQRRNR